MLLSERRGHQKVNKKLSDVENNQEEADRPERKKTWAMLIGGKKKLLMMMAVIGLGLVWVILPPNNTSNEVLTVHHKLPKPFTQRYDASKVFTKKIRIHGVDITFGTRKLSDEEFILGHVSREINGYALMKDAILLARSANKKERPLVLDVGSNHGLYSIFAAKLGADVITIEPQESLCRLINEVAVLNQVESQITVYHNAVLDQNENVTLANAQINEGGIATVVRGGTIGRHSRPVPTMETFPICDFVPTNDRRRIAFLKIDVEGFELRAIPSAGNLLKRADNILVEFGPPMRWRSAARDNSTTGMILLQDMHTKYGMTPRLIDSLAWPTHLEKLDKNQKSLAIKEKLVSLATKSSRQTLIDSMVQSSSEGYVWFVRHAKSHFATFEKDCGGDHSFKKNGAKNLTLFGCNVD